MILADDLQPAPFLVRRGVGLLAKGEEVKVILCSEVGVVVEDVDGGHPVGVVVARALLDDRLLRLVRQQRDRLHQVTHDDEITTHRHVQRHDVPVVRTLLRQLVRRTALLLLTRVTRVRMGNYPAAPGDPSEQLNLAVDPREQLPVERVEVVHRTLHLLLRHQLKLTVLGSKHQNSTPRRFGLLRQRIPRAHDVIRTRVIREDARDDARVLLVGLEPELVQGFEGDVVEESDKVGLGASVKVFSQRRVRPRLRLVRDSPRLLAERDGAYVQLLYVVDAADGEVGLGREREGVGKCVAVERTRV